MIKMNERIINDLEYINQTLDEIFNKMETHQGEALIMEFQEIIEMLKKKKEK